MRITHVVENLARGGLERVVIDLALAQREAGHAARVICLFEHGALAEELLTRGIEVLACGKRRGVDVRALARLRGWLRQQPDGVLHTHNAMAHYYAALASRGIGLRRVINTRHSMSSRDGASRGEWLYRRSMRVTDHAVAVCEAARLRLAQEGVRPRRRLLAIPNGIHLDGFRPASADARDALAATLGLAPGTRIVGTVGRLNPIKDQATLIRAFRQAHAAHRDSALVLVGDGDERARLETVAEEEGVRAAVHFLGDRRDVKALLPAFDLFVLSSLSEGYSMALLEACASALPIVATRVGGNAEIVRDGVNGRLVASGDAAALAAALAAMLRRPPQELVALGRAGRAWVLAEGSFATMAGRYDALYADA